MAHSHPQSPENPVECGSHDVVLLQLLKWRWSEILKLYTHLIVTGTLVYNQARWHEQQMELDALHSLRQLPQRSLNRLEQTEHQRTIQQTHILMNHLYPNATGHPNSKIL